MDKRLRIGLAALAIGALAVSSAAAQMPDRFRRSMGNLDPNPSRRSMGNLWPREDAGGGDHHGGGPARPGHGHSSRHHFHGPGYPVPYFGYGYLPGIAYPGLIVPGWGWELDPFYGAHPYVYRPGYYREDFWYSAPLVLPSETIYGPEAVKRFFGFDQPPVVPGDMMPEVAPPALAPRGAQPAPPAAQGAPQAAPPVAAQPAADPQPAPGPFAAEPRPKATLSPEATAAGWRYIGFGDAHFEAQRYNEAYQRYKRAAEAAPQLVVAYLRQVVVLTALGSYDLAARALRKGLAVDPSWPGAMLKLEELYGENQMARRAHLEALITAQEDDPTSADLSALLGVALHFDGQAERAVPLFERAAALGFDRGLLAQALTGSE